MKRVYRIKEEIRVALNWSWLHHCSCSSSRPRVTDGAAVKYQAALFVIILHSFQVGILFCLESKERRLFRETGLSQAVVRAL